MTLLEQQHASTQRRRELLSIGQPDRRVPGWLCCDECDIMFMAWLGSKAARMWGPDILCTLFVNQRKN